MKKRKSRKSKKQSDYEIDSDENFYFIAGYTSDGVPYGTTWEEAHASGLVEDEVMKEGETHDEYPFF